jgi:hypothetical protein
MLKCGIGRFVLRNTMFVIELDRFDLSGAQNPPVKRQFRERGRVF